MANRPKGYGYTAEMKNRIAAKYDVDKEQEARLWIEDVVGEELDPGSDRNTPLGPDRFHEVLKDGIFLCKLADEVVGGVKHNTSPMAFKQMENINTFLTTCRDIGLVPADLFQTVDLYESQNMWQVVTCIHAFGRKARRTGFQGPFLGPREAEKHPRQFSPEKLNEGKFVIGMQMSSHRGANQSGMAFGTYRQILGSPPSISGSTSNEPAVNGTNVRDSFEEQQAQQANALHNDVGIQTGVNGDQTQEDISNGSNAHLVD